MNLNRIGGAQLYREKNIDHLWAAQVVVQTMCMCIDLQSRERPYTVCGVCCRARTISKTLSGGFLTPRGRGPDMRSGQKRLS